MLRARAVVPLLVVLALVALPAGAFASTSPKRKTNVTTKGYKGIKRVPRVGEQPAPPSVSLGAGQRPDVLVDAAGTAHVVWNEEVPVGGSDVTHYCRLPRGATTCANPSETPFPPIDAPFSGDFDGPKIVQLGDGLVVLTHRYPAVVRQPDGQDRDRTTYAYTSLDGGQSWTGPAIAGTSQINGDVAAVGDTIATISDTVTGGTSAQLVSPARFSAAAILLGPGDQAYDGTIAAEGTTPIAAFRGLDNQIRIRRYGGAGDVNDPGTWTTATLAGVQPSLATGPAGTWLQYRSSLLGPWAVQPLTAAAQPSGQAVQVSPEQGNSDQGELLEDASGRLRSLFVAGAGPERLYARTREAAGSFAGAAVVAQADGLAALRASMTDDGGGVSVVERTLGATQDIAVSAFGSLAPTGKGGAGSLAGTGIPGAEAGCQLVKFGSVQARPAQNGCFFPSTDPAYRGAVVAAGEIDLNGLAIVPGANVKIVIDPRRRTIDTTGTVSVVLRGGGLPELTLMRGELHLRLDGDKASAGQSLLNLPANGLDLAGFPIAGTIDVKLAADGARIPISLRLPPALGGISGDALLSVNPLKGVTVESARIAAEHIPLGPLALDDLDIGYAAGQWDGKAKLTLPPPSTGASIALSVTFKNGRFVKGSVDAGLPGLGVVIGPNVYLRSVGGTFGVDPLFAQIRATIGAFPISPTPPKFTVTANGSLTLRIAKEVELELRGDVGIFDVGVADGHGLITTGGYAELGGQFKIDLAGVVTASGDLSVKLDGPTKRFAGTLNGDVSVADAISVGGSGVISNTGVGLCADIATGSAGVFVHAAARLPAFFGSFDSDCEEELGTYKGPDVARSAQAGASTFSVPAGTKTASVEVTGAGGVPSVVLVGPGGQQVAPVSVAQATAGSAAFAYPVAKQSQLIVALKTPAAGTWTVQAQPGSVPLAGVRAALPVSPVKVRGSLRGSGRTRTLRYTASGLSAGTQVQVYEDAGQLSRPLGVITRSSGTLRLRAGEGVGGTRRLVGFVVRDGGTFGGDPIAIATYKAPGAAAAPRIRGARATLRKGRATVSWRRAGVGAASYLVTVRLRDGRVLTREVRRSRSSVRISRLGAAAKLSSATVRSITATRLLGPVGKATVRRR